MADFQQQMFRHLQSARQWLMRAEEDFSRDDDIRGELNLFLAQAELQHFQESKKSKSWRYKYPIIRHGFAIFLALSVIGLSFGGAYWLSNRQQVVPIPLAKQETKNIVQIKQPVDEVRSIQTPSQKAVVVDTTAVKQAEPRAVPDRQERIHNSSQADQEIDLPPNEMQKLIREAGKSLRGQ